MELLERMRHAAYATVGAGDWMWTTLRDGIDRAWHNRSQWSGQIEYAYDDLVGRGEALLTKTGSQARHRARRTPEIAAIEGEIAGLAGDADDLPIADYDDLTAAQITSQLAGLSQRGLHQIEGYEASHQHRVTVLRHIDGLRGSEPWPGYDEMNVDEILPRLRALPADQRAELATYEQRHKKRSTVIDTAHINAE